MRKLIKLNDRFVAFCEPYYFPLHWTALVLCIVFSAVISYLMLTGAIASLLLRWVDVGILVANGMLCALRMWLRWWTIRIIR